MLGAFAKHGRFRASAPIPRLQRAGVAVCLVIAAASAVVAVADARRLDDLISAQLDGAPQGSDFLNLYTGAQLVLGDPSNTYQPTAQQAIQQRLRAAAPFTPFYLPPYAAVLIAWLALLPFATAYNLWLVIGLGSVVLAWASLAPPTAAGKRWWPLLWAASSFLFLPLFLGLAQGQTSALMLLGFAGVCRWLPGAPRAHWRLALSALTWTLKPQLAVWLVVSLVLARRTRALVRLAFMLALLSALSVWVLGSSAIGDYVALAHTKLIEAFVADSSLLPGPTLLHASQWLLGVGWTARRVAAALVCVAVLAFGCIWRKGLASDDMVLVQLASLPVLSIICAPYALVHELASWPACFWLLWQYTASRSGARTVLVWFGAAVWLAGDLGVVRPRLGGADIAALLGLGCMVGLACLVVRHDRALLTRVRNDGVTAATT